MTIDHFQNVYPRTIWDRDLTWIAGERPTPHEFFDYQVLLGFLASRAGLLRLGVGVTEPIRRHPVLIAQAMMTLSHLTKRAPILGIGAGERMNLGPYGLDSSEPVTRLEETLQIIRPCFSAPITFSGKHFQLDAATMDLEAPRGRMPEIWIGLVSRRAALYAFRAIGRIARSLPGRHRLMGHIDTTNAVLERSR